MVEETWYRGTATGVMPARGETHDLGDGVYYTDNLQTAYSFAGMRTQSEDQLPYVSWGRVDPAAQGRVLDVTSGPMKTAWDRFSAEPNPMTGTTNLDLMKMGGGNYGRMFGFFLSREKLNLSDYDIIIGPNYLQHGGRQMCVRTRAVQNNVDSRFVPGAPPKPAGTGPANAMTINLTYSARGQANASALVCIFLIADAALHYFTDKFREADTQAALKATVSGVRTWQNEYPTDGALIVITFKRTVASSDFIQNRLLIQPGDNYESDSVYFGETPEAAAKKFQQEKEWVQGDVIDGPYKTVRRKQGVWIPPRLAQDNVALASPIGGWKVKIGDWSGWFTFRANGSCAWSDAASGPQHSGTWKIVGSEVQWSYSEDPKDWPRIFHAKLPLSKKVGGEVTIKGVNHGYYEMTKT